MVGGIAGEIQQAELQALILNTSSKMRQGPAVRVPTALRRCHHHRWSHQPFEVQ
jgi:hypothetical protein